ncbi:hypothetical protein [Aureimonas mangrovi]|uniref:hypothetical protein n=1 Tax=Aureimonas mangrovi TaxID=2758041 RepID=UPI00163DB22A|nr:hypothetical protein [Aureimonas mangrovi]
MIWRAAPIALSVTADDIHDGSRKIMLRTGLFALLLLTIAGCAQGYVPTSNSADPAESSPPPDTPFMERRFERVNS